jgi:uncharacterized membrane-anchored protein
VPLAAEAHSRPFLRLSAPATLTHFAIYCDRTDISDSGNASKQYQILLALCAHFGVTGPKNDARYFFHDFGRFQLKWESHTEFSTYTFAQNIEENLRIADAFDHVPLSHIPPEWLTSLQGKIIVAAHVVLDKSPIDQESDVSNMRQVFEGNVLVGSNTMQCGEVWTDFLIQSDGFSRFVVRDVDMREQQAGRLVQRVLEIETYRMMALLGLPHAQRTSPILNSIEGELAKLTSTMVNIGMVNGHIHSDINYDEQELLGTLTALAARLEKLSLDNNYRFSASHAYFKLIEARIDELRETRIEGVPTIAEFMDRRLAPAMNTCHSVEKRQAGLANRIAHTNDLLRTRVGVAQEQQNRKILQSLNTRAAQQLRLQQAVEGLSVAAISYYMAGLAGDLAKGLQAAGIPVNPDLSVSLLLPVIGIVVMLGLRKIHREVHAA